MSGKSSPPIGADILLLVIANAIWATTDVVAKYALGEMSPEALALMRYTIALMAFAPVLWLRRTEIPRSFRTLMPFAALGMCGFFLNIVLHYHGLKYAPPSHATALRVSEALMIVLLSAIFLRERIGKIAAAGLALGTAGVVVVLDIDFGDLSLFASGYRYGDLLILAAIVVEANYTVIGKRVLDKTSPLLATALACAFGWAMMSALYGAPVVSELIANPPSAGIIAAAAYLGILANGLSFWLYYKVLSRRPSHKVGISIMIQPLVGIPLAAIIFSDPMTMSFIAGAACIIGGVYLTLGTVSEQTSSEVDE